MSRARYYGKKLSKAVTRLLPYGVQEAANNLYVEFDFFVAHQLGKFKARKYQNERDLKLHLGCGKNYKTGWINIDIGGETDLNLDLRRPLPLAENSCEMIYSEHFLEHMDYPYPAKLFLNECYRVLKPGGTLDLSVPDMELVLKSYVLGGTEEYYAAQKMWHPAWCRTQMDHINHNFRQKGEHRYAYDFETLSFALEQCGFVEIERRSFDPDLDREDRIVGSLYVKCRKPIL